LAQAAAVPITAQSIQKTMAVEPSNSAPCSKTPSVGILSGISYNSGIDYYKGINEGYISKGNLKNPAYPMPSFPHVQMVSVDCAEYASYLVDKEWGKTREYLWRNGISRLIGMLERGEIDFIIQASNTSHMALELEALKEVERGAEYYSMLLKWQDRFLHIADATASAIRDEFVEASQRNSESPCTAPRSAVVVGLLGTEPTMRERYLKDRLLLHKDVIKDVVAPQKDEDLKKIFEVIMGELSSPIEIEYHEKTKMKRPKFKEETRDYFVSVIRESLIKEQGAQCVVLGCTEIELLIKQEDIPEVPIFPSAELHMDACVEVLLGKKQVGALVPDVQ